MSYFFIVVNGVKKSPAEWGIKLDAQLEKRDQEKHVLTLTSTERFDAAPQFNFMAPVTVYQTDDPADAPANRKIWFQGFFAFAKSVSDRGIQVKEYQAFNLWWILERIVYRQNRVIAAAQAFWPAAGQPQQFVGNNDLLTPNAPNTLIQATTPELYLGYDALTGALQSTGQVIANALQWANQVFNPTRRGSQNPDPSRDLCIVGTIQPAMQIPIQQVNCLSCAEVIREMLKPHPTATVQIDYSTVPPTVNVWRAPQVVAKPLDLSAHPPETIQLRPRYDLQPSAVTIWFKIVSQINDQNVITWLLDIWPAPNDPQTLLKPDLLAAVIELQGTRLTTAHVKLHRAPVDANNADAAARVAWWKIKKRELGAANVDPASVVVALPTSVVDDNGNAVDLTAYPFEMTGGEHATANLGFDAKRVTIRAQAQWNVYADNTLKALLRSENAEISVRITVTNATQDDYFPITGGVTAEPVPIGLAQALYNEWSSLQYDGSSDSLQPTVIETDDDIEQGDVVNLTGLNTSYQGLIVVGSTHQLGQRRRRLEFGVSHRLSVQDYIRLMMLWRFRFRWHNPIEANTGNVAGDGQIELGTDHPLENTDSGAAAPGKDSSVFDFTPDPAYTPPTPP